MADSCVQKYAGGFLKRCFWRKSQTLITLEIASTISDHALAVFELMGADPDIECPKTILRWIKNNGQSSFTKRECHQGVKGSYKRASDLEAAYEVLEDRGYIRQLTKAPKGAGRPSLTFEINPTILEGRNGLA